jgi:hypothetical protein
MAQADAIFCVTARTALPSALRALAETRRALVAAEFPYDELAGAGVCPRCFTYDGKPHDPACFLATMPRPEQ